MNEEMKIFNSATQWKTINGVNEANEEINNESSASNENENGQCENEMK